MWWLLLGGLVITLSGWLRVFLYVLLVVLNVRSGLRVLLLNTITLIKRC